MEPAILLKDIVLRWPAVYSKASGNESIPARHSVSFLATEELIALFSEQGIHPRLNKTTGESFFHAKTGWAPIVTPRNADIETMLRALQIADARNIPRDRLLSLKVCDVRVRPYGYNLQGTTGRALAVEEIIVDAVDMLCAAMETGSD